MAPHVPSPTASFFSQLDVSPPASPRQVSAESIEPLLREIRDGQDRQNALLEELVQILGTAQRQRAGELAAWKKAHPQLSADCRRAADALGPVQAEYLRRLTAEVRENAADLAEGDFLTNEFIDRFAPRLVQMHGLLQILSHLGGNGQQVQATESA
jgi:hypothetical protein